MTADESQLPFLRSIFAHEVKRNLFEAFLRPRETVINLVSNSISSAAAFPGGEAFHFSFSPNGHHVLAYSTSRIYVINISEPQLVVKRELKILRRPASVTILDDGSLLAVLSTDHQVDLYDLTGVHPHHIQAVALDHAPRTIALAPEGSVLAAAYDGGVEVYSLASTALVTDRRSVKCDGADSLSFSQDGTQLLGTTLHSRNPSTVILTAPYYDPGDLIPPESISQLWTTSILFPNSSRDCSHALLLPSPSDDEASWTFTYDRVFETFRAVRIDDLRNGTTYFTGPTPDKGSVGKLLPCTLPAATSSGELVVAGFQGKEIWLYGVPEDLDASPDAGQNGISITESEAATPTGSSRRNSAPWLRDSTNNRIPQWQLLCDKSRNAFVEGRKVSTLEGISAMKWVTQKQGKSCSERLIITAPGVVGQPAEGEEDGMAPVDGGRFSILDFDYRPTNGEKCILTIEVGEKEPEVLEEEHRDMEAEVAIARRRTVAQKKGYRTSVFRSATIVPRPSPPAGAAPLRAVRVPDSAPALPLPPIGRDRLHSAEEQPETTSIDEEQEALDAPYSHGSPRSAPTLRRAATAAAINRRLNPPRVAEHVEYRRADGREEHPHESDADNWVPPPPPYTREPVTPLPEHLRNVVLAGSLALPSPNSLHRSSTQRSGSSIESSRRRPLPQRPQSSFVPSIEPGGQSSIAGQRVGRSSASSVTSGVSFDAVRQRRPSLPTDFDELYDVSPPATPDPVLERPLSAASAAAEAPHVPAIAAVRTIPRRPVASTATATPPLHSAAINALLLRPVSPMPQQTVSEEIEKVGSKTFEKSEGTRDSSNLLISRPPSSAGSARSLAHSKLELPILLRPNNEHHPTELPSSTPIITPQDEGNDVEGSNKIPRSVEASPTALSSGDILDGSPDSVVPPSAIQLARLNSRRARPSSRMLIDPSRRGSGSISQSQPSSPVPQDNNLIRAPVLRTPSPINPPNLTSPIIPAHADSSIESPSFSPMSYPPPSNLPWRSNTGPLSSAQTTRPQMQRLDTIESVASQGDHSTHFRSAAARFGISRKPSRAERSAALKIQQAKRRGWRGTRKNKKKDGDGASSAGWSDVTRDLYLDDWDETTPDKKGKTRCILM